MKREGRNDRPGEIIVGEKKGNKKEAEAAHSEIGGIYIEETKTSAVRRRSNQYGPDKKKKKRRQGKGKDKEKSDAIVDARRKRKEELRGRVPVFARTLVLYARRKATKPEKRGRCAAFLPTAHERKKRPKESETRSAEKKRICERKDRSGRVPQLLKEEIRCVQFNPKLGEKGQGRHARGQKRGLGIMGRRAAGAKRQLEEKRSPSRKERETREHPTLEKKKATRWEKKNSPGSTNHEKEVTARPEKKGKAEAGVAGQ